MVSAVKLVAEKRIKLGSAESRRMRRNGIVPANVYGHGLDPVALSVSDDDLRPIVMSGTQVVEIDIDGTTETAIIREVQWDTFSTYIQHVDLIRVDPNERVTVDVAIVLRGTPLGVVAGGRLDQQLHLLTLDCRAVQIPDSITVRVGKLEIGDSILVSDLKMQEGVVAHNPPESIVVRVNEAVELEDEEDADMDAGPAEPELVGRKAEDEESDGD